MNFRSKQLTTTAIGLLLSLSSLGAHAQTPTERGKEKQKEAQEQSEAGETVLETIVVLSASEQTKQAPGVSIISSADIEKRPPANDVSEIIRKMPGVNLTGNSASGARGNNRQIDIRGMGPENTLILIDGKPVLSRNSVRYSPGGERDTRGDSNWVPAEAIDRIEVFRGPAAARYGSGASGGVVNIITKPATEKTISVTTFANIPEDSREGGNRRANILASGPINESFSYRLYGNISVTDPDKIDINGPGTDDGRGGKLSAPAGREGVVNKDIRGLLTWQVDPENRLDFEAGWSRQSNKYAGDTQFGTGTPDDIIKELARDGDETNRMTRTTLSVTHRGDYEFGTSESYIQWERTINRRLLEGLTGRGEGSIITDGDPKWGTATLNNLSAKSEWNLPLTTMGYDHVLTVGLDYRGEFMKDPTSIIIDLPDGTDIGIPGSAADRDTKASSHLIGLYFEDNVHVTDALILTPGVRFDYQDQFGFNASPSLNASYKITDEITLKGGIARAFKAPNLFQLNPNYIYTSNGNGCWQMQGPCYILGNPDLDPEISINKEIGINYTDDRGWNAGVTYFHNDYKNRIGTGRVVVGTVPGTGWWGPVDNRLYRWENSGPAVISGIEGNISVPLHEDLTWSTNFTKMIKTEDDDGQPLSLIPEHTINTALEWQATERLGFILSATHFGKITPPTVTSYTGVPREGDQLKERPSYTIVNFGLDFAAHENVTLTAGVNNLFDKKLQRTSEGANTFNEPGRSYYLSLRGTF